MSQLIDTITNRLHQLVQDGKLSNDDLIQIIELAGSYLNLQTRSAWAKNNGKSYNAAKHFRQNVQLFGVSFVVENE